MKLHLQREMPKRSALERLAEIAARTAEETGKFANVDAILRIPVTMQVVLGSATIPVANLMKLGAAPWCRWITGSESPLTSWSTAAWLPARGVVVVEEDISRFAFAHRDRRAAGAG